MELETPVPITWFINSRALLEKLLRHWDRTSLDPLTVDRFLDGVRKLDRHRSEGPDDAARLMGLDEETEPSRKAVVLVPIEFSELSLEAAKVGVSIARHTGGQLVLCHALLGRVIPFGPANPAWVTEALRHEAMKKMKCLLDLAKEARVTATCEIEEGTPTGVILKLARIWGADLIVLTAEKVSMWSRLLFGPRTTERVLEQAECHVMVLRNGRSI